MSLNRRAFFQVAAAAPIAGALALPSLAPATEAATAGVVPPFQYPWVWRLSLDGGEIYTEEFETKEQALAALAEHGGKYAQIAECQCQDFDLRIDANDIWEAMRGRNEEAIGDGEFIETTREQDAELENAVNAVIAAWAEKHNVNQTAWQFGGVRNEITVADLGAKP